VARCRLGECVPDSLAAMQRRWLGAVLIALVGMLAACGGGSGSKSSVPCPPAADTRAAVGGKVTVCGFDIHFDVKTITTPAGPLEITFVNKGSQAHTFTIDNPKLDLNASPGKSKTGSVTLAKGTYKFKCTVDSHDQAGMHGTIEVS
jgi:plastocyanin